MRMSNTHCFRLESTFPSCFGRALQTHGLQHKNAFVRHTTLQAIMAMLRRFARLLKVRARTCLYAYAPFLVHVDF